MMKSFLIVGALLVLFSSCKDEQTPVPPDPNDTNLTVTMQPQWNNSVLYLDSTYTTSDGYDIQFIELKCYLENVRNGSDILKDAGLFDYRQRGTLFFNTKNDPATFTSLQANVGVQSSLNHSDPSAFPVESALNTINANDMHWDWNPGYIFIKVEARVDTIPDGNALFDHFIVYHVGGDVNLQQADFQNLSWVKDNDTTYHLPLYFDMNTFFVNGASIIDIKTESSSHTNPGEEAISLKVMQNFAAAIKP